jgi:hypothetical protein
MGITVTWDDWDKTVVRLDFGEGWTWRDYDRAVDVANALIAGRPHAVDVISNLLLSPNMPLGPVLSHLYRTKRLLPKNVGCMVVVGGGAAFRHLLGLFLDVFPQLGRKTVLANSVAEARAVIARRRREPGGSATRV